MYSINHNKISGEVKNYEEAVALFNAVYDFAKAKGESVTLINEDTGEILANNSKEK